MTSWNLASADHAVSLSLQLTGSQTEVLTGTITFGGIQYGVAGGWAASGSVTGRNYSAFALSGSANGPNGAPNFIAATGIMSGFAAAPTQIDIQADISSSGNGTVVHYGGVLVPD